jgi:hypothetical protein
MGAMALHGYSSMELKSRSFTSKEPHVARKPQGADPCCKPQSKVWHFSLKMGHMSQNNNVETPHHGKHIFIGFEVKDPYICGWSIDIYRTPTYFYID